MRKILTIAAREYRAMVGTKAFAVSIVMMPILMLGSIAIMALLTKVTKISERKIAVIDHSGVMYQQLEKAAEAHNQKLEKMVAEGGESEKKLGDSGEEKYVLELIDAKVIDDELRFELSDRIRNQDLYAFLEIPKGVFDLPPPPPGKSAQDEPGLDSNKTVKPDSLDRSNEVSEDKLSEDGSASSESSEDPSSNSSKATGNATHPPGVARFYSPDSSISKAKNFFASQINQLVRKERMKAAKLDLELVNRASQGLPVQGLGLLSRAADGVVQAATEESPLKAIFLPMGVMMLMFMVIFMAAQPMLESVLEEKSQRIAEVLLGSANPFQLMIGKLLGTVAGSLTIFAIYLTGGYFLAQQQGWTDQIPFHLAPWFIAFQVVGVFFYASIFMAVGASVTQLKEAQSLLLPVWMLMMSPMFVWLMLVRDPLGMMATGFSLFPPATPTTMMLRMTTGHTIPIWQPIVGLLLTLGATLLIVVLAARIFRVGILWQGKTPKFGEIIRWAIKGE